MVLAWPSPFIPKIVTDKENYNLTHKEASYIPILNTVGLLISLPFTLLLPDRFGRKPTLLFSGVPFAACWILKFFFTNLYVLYLARFVAGLGDALLLSSLPLYIGEVAIPEVRGVWGNSLIVSGYLGQFLMNIVGSYLSVKDTSLICLSVPIVFVISFSFMPESPYFYIMQGKYEEAKTSLRKFRLKENIDDEFLTLKSDVQRQMSESGTIKDLFFIKSNRRALVAGLFMRISQMLSGLFVFISYTQFIFLKAGGNVDPSVSAIIYTGLAATLFLVASVFAEKLGRKKSLSISLVLSAVVLLLEGFYFYVDQYIKEIDLSNLKWFPLAGMLVFLIFVSFGVAIIPTLMLSELFSASIKAKAVSIVMAAYAISYVLMNTLFYQLTSSLGLCAPFFVFGICNIVSAFLVGILVPETKGKTLEDIQQDLKSN